MPSLLGLVLYLLLLSLDQTFRRLQPFRSLIRDGGATAEESLLLDYPARLPISVTLSAGEWLDREVTSKALLPSRLGAPLTRDYTRDCYPSFSVHFSQDSSSH